MMDSFLNIFATAWYSHRTMQMIGEGLLISAVIFTVFLVLDRSLRKQLSVQSQHLLILGGFASVLLGFAMSQTHWPLSGIAGPAPALVTLTVRPDAIAQTAFDWSVVLLTLYLVPVSLLMIRLLLGLWQLRKVRIMSASIVDTKVLSEVMRIETKLKINRNVSVRTSTLINSPLSFGALRPLVLLPVEALQWSEQTLRHVLSHELSHVHRCDYLSKLLCYSVASFLWINPLCWILLRRLDSCAETACDMQAAAIEDDNADYATTLLSVARRCHQHAAQPLLFAQTMLDRSSLETRIVHLLEGKTMQTKELKKERRNVLFTLGLISTFLIVTLANTQIVSAQPSADNVERRGEFFPIEDVIPMYPTVAAAEGIEGWAQVKFTVGVDGLVLADTVEIVDAEPADVFNNSAIAAAKKFRFSQYAPDGFPVMIPNVQYVFRYKMNDD